MSLAFMPSFLALSAIAVAVQKRSKALTGWNAVPKDKAGEIKERFALLPCTKNRIFISPVKPQMAFGKRPNNASRSKINPKTPMTCENRTWFVHQEGSTNTAMPTVKS